MMKKDIYFALFVLTIHSFRLGLKKIMFFGKCGQVIRETTLLNMKDFLQVLFYQFPNINYEKSVNCKCFW